MSDVKHIAFLALWLSCCVFCFRSLKVAKKFITISSQLHKGRNLCLSQMILGSLYENLGMAVAIFKNITPETNFLLAGPFWLADLNQNQMSLRLTDLNQMKMMS